MDSDNMDQNDIDAHSISAPLEHDLESSLDTSSDTSEDESQKVIRAFVAHAAAVREQKMSLVGEFNSRLFDEAVELTVHRLRARLGEDLV